MAYLKLPLPYCCDFLPLPIRKCRKNTHAKADPLKDRHQQKQHSRPLRCQPGFKSSKTSNPNHRAHTHNDRHRRLDRRKMSAADMGNAKQIAPDEPADDQPKQKHRQRSPRSYARATQAQRNHSPAGKVWITCRKIVWLANPTPKTKARLTQAQQSAITIGALDFSCAGFVKFDPYVGALIG
jgi:hypothetical protein